MSAYALNKSKHSKTCHKQLVKRDKKGFQDRYSLYAGQTYCRMLPEHSAVLLTCINYYMALRPLFCLILSDRLRQVSLYLNKWTEPLVTSSGCVCKQ